MHDDEDDEEILHQLIIEADAIDEVIDDDVTQRHIEVDEDDDELDEQLADEVDASEYS